MRLPAFMIELHKEKARPVASLFCRRPVCRLRLSLQPLATGLSKKRLNRANKENAAPALCLRQRAASGKARRPAQISTPLLLPAADKDSTLVSMNWSVFKSCTENQRSPDFPQAELLPASTAQTRRRTFVSQSHWYQHKKIICGR